MLDTLGGDRLVEIGCVEMVNRILTGNIYHVYINPERDMPAEAFRVHGLSAEFLSDKPVFAKVADEFLEFIAEDTGSGKRSDDGRYVRLPHGKHHAVPHVERAVFLPRCDVARLEKIPEERIHRPRRLIEPR
mgnify:CR=1 FL=1